jgi:hypothetical protein
MNTSLTYAFINRNICNYVYLFKLQILYKHVSILHTNLRNILLFIICKVKNSTKSYIKIENIKLLIYLI